MVFSTNMAFPPHHHPFMFQSLEDQHHDHHHLPSPTSLPSCPPQLFHGGGGAYLMKRSVSFSGMDKSEDGHGDDELSDDGSQLGEKKKRLNLEQVKALEKSFELGNKLEPERKMQLAKALGLQPRQIAIWFQNRRARWKTKQLEKDYEALKKQFEILKADNDALQAHNKKLTSQLVSLKRKDQSSEVNMNMKQENEGCWSNGSDDHENSTTCDVNLDLSRSAAVMASNPVCNNSQLSSSKHLFPSSNIITRTTNMTQLLQGTSRQDLQCLKLDQQVQDHENFCNMFNNINDQDHHQQGSFWAWPEHQNYH